MTHASNPLRLTHTCNFPCMKTISKTKDFCFSSHESFIGHTPIIMLDHPPIFSLDTLRKYCGQPSYLFHWTHSENTVDNPPIFSLDILRKYCGQPSEFFHWTHSENTVDNPPIFSLDILRKYYGQPSDIFSLDTLRKYCGQPSDIFIRHTPKILWTTLRYFFIGHTPKILWTTLRYFHWTHFENTVDNPPIFSLDILRKYYGQPSDIFIGHNPIIMLDNHPIKTACSKSCRALTPDIRDVLMHVKCDAITWYLLIFMHSCINIILKKLHVIQLRK